MRNRSKRREEFLWPLILMKKWLHIKPSGDGFSADDHDDTGSEIDDEDTSLYTEDSPSNNRRRSFAWRLLSDSAGRARSVSKFLRSGQEETVQTQNLDTEELRIAVGTWNVAGKTPPPDLDLEEWLGMHSPADIYVLGFQEIVPLNAGNVLGVLDYGPALKWQALIRRTLNKPNPSKHECQSAPSSPWKNERSEASDIVLETPEINYEHLLVEENTSSIAPQRTRMPSQDDMQLTATKKNLKRDHSSTERTGLTWTIKRTVSEPASWFSKIAAAVTPSDDGGYTEDELMTPLLSPCPRSDLLSKKSVKNGIRYIRTASKQMVGIHISVWVHRKIRRYIHNLSVSTVGMGLMGCLGNKGSVAVSMTLHQTSFCFICAHLTSGDREGDELRRNADVMEILRRTNFLPLKSMEMDVPETILAHDRIILLGDLNYRLDLSDGEAKSLVAKKEWEALLQKDQLRKEFKEGQVFEGWHEGPIGFAPTYKYEMNSDVYFGENSKTGEKRRTPAWCDRILWHGKGLRNLTYMRVESKLSDHRPVQAMFLADVDVLNGHKFRKATSFMNATLEIEELLPYTRTDRKTRFKGGT